MADGGVRAGKTGPIPGPLPQQTKPTSPQQGPQAAPPTPQAKPQTPQVKPQGDRLQTGPLPPKAPDPLHAYPQFTPHDREAVVQEALQDGPKGLVGEAVDYWHEQRKQDGMMGYVAAGMEGLLEFSGLPAVERSAQELGARVGADADGKAWAATKLTFNCGMVVLNGLVAGKAISSGAKSLAAGNAALQAGKAALPNVVRHYTTAEAVAGMMNDGVLFASKSGLSGGNKVYMLAENTAEGGMNIFRRFNIGHLTPSSTAKAIEIDLAALPPAMREKFTVEASKGILSLENFVTHAGDIKLAELGSALKVVDASKLSVTMDQALKSGYALTQVGQLSTDAKNAATALSRGAY